MSIETNRNVQVEFSGDLTFQLIQSALPNPNALASVAHVNLLVGNNTLVPPTATSGLLITALTIIPPAANPNTIILKGANGDVGIPLHLTDPTTIALFSPLGPIILNVTVEVDGVTLVWS
jgi:hypothetical protein